jgi:peroxiredoxin
VSGRSFVQTVIPVAILAAFTIWITWRAKSLETHLVHSLEALQPGNPGPSFRLASLDGRTVSSEELRGKGKLVVSFWASWCGPCREELPALAALYRKTHQAEDGYELVAISEDTVTADAQGAAARLKLPFPVLLDPSGATLASYGVQGIPALFVIDENGAVKQVHVGYRAGLEIVLAHELGFKDYSPFAPRL